MMLESMGFGVHVLGLSAAPLFIDILIDLTKGEFRISGLRTLYSKGI